VSHQGGALCGRKEMTMTANITGAPGRPAGHGVPCPFGGRVAAIVVVAVGLLVGAAPALANRARLSKTERREVAREHFLDGKRAYEQGLYEEAIRSFREAGALSPSPVLDYNLARCFERLDQPRQALKLYVAYLKARPRAANRAQVQQRVKALKARIAPPHEAGRASKASPRARPGATVTVAAPPLPGEQGKDTPGKSSTAAPNIAGRGKQNAAGATKAPGPRLMLKGEAGPTGEGSLLKTDPDQPSGTASEPGVHAMIPHEAETAPPPQKGARATGGQPRPGDEAPLYKTWYFWVAVVGALGIGAFIIGTAVSSRGDASPATSTPQALMAPSPRATPGRALLTF